MTRALKPGDVVAVRSFRMLVGEVAAIVSHPHIGRVGITIMRHDGTWTMNIAPSNIIGPAHTPAEVIARQDRRGPPDGWTKAARRAKR